MKNIIVTIDFETNQQLVIDQAIALGEKFNAKLWLLHVAAPDPDFVGMDVGPQTERDSRAHQLREEHRQLEAYSDKISHQGVAAQSLLIQGATIELIMEKAKTLKADLIITGHHEHGFLYKAFIGSVSNQIIKQAKIPVLIVPLD